MTNNNKKSITAACCVIGDEILSGKTKDTNSHYLGMNCKSLGWVDQQCFNSLLLQQRYCSISALS